MAITSATSSGAGRSSNRLSTPTNFSTTQKAAAESFKDTNFRRKNSRADDSSHMSLWSYDKRYQYALDNGMSKEQAAEWASLQYTITSDGFWSGAFGTKKTSTASIEANDARDADTFNQLRDSSRVQEYEDPSAQAERRQNAGINDALSAGKELGTGDPANVDDLATSQSADLSKALSSEEFNKPFQVASAMMNAIGGVMNLINAGVDIQKSIFSMDIQEGQSAVDMIGRISDLGNFFPFLGVEYDPNEDTWYELDDKVGAGRVLGTERVYGMPKSEFFDRISKNTGIKSRRYLREMYNMYRGMASPKAINSYMDQRKHNIDIQNETIDASAGGIARTGAMTQPTAPFNGLGLNVGLPLSLTTPDRDVFTKYIGYVSDLQLYGLEAARAGKKNARDLAEMNDYIYDVTSRMIQDLRQDSIVKHSPLATYLLVNMMSGTFNDIGQAAYINSLNRAPQTWGEAWQYFKDASTMNFLQAQPVLGRIMQRDLPSKSKVKIWNMK